MSEAIATVGDPDRRNHIAGLLRRYPALDPTATAELVEYIGGSPYVDDITEGGWKLDQDGMLAIPDAPGLGISLDRAAVHELTRNADAILG